MRILALCDCSKGDFADDDRPYGAAKRKGWDSLGPLWSWQAEGWAGPREGVAQKRLISSGPVSAQVPSLQHRLELPA